MARGYPDYSPGAARSEQNEFLPFIALAPTWFLDDFESPVIKWEPVLGVSGLDSTPSGPGTESPVYSGSTCLKLTAAVGAVCVVVRSIGVPPFTTRSGVSLVFRLGTKADYHATLPGAFLITADYLFGGNDYQVLFGYNPNTGIWSVSQDNAATWTAILTYSVSPFAFHYVKIVYDMAALTYISFNVDHHTVDLRAYNIGSGVVPGDASLNVVIEIVSSPANQAVAWVDHFRITYGES